MDSFAGQSVNACQQGGSFQRKTEAVPTSSNLKLYSTSWPEIWPATPAKFVATDAVAAATDEEAR